ncbi:Short-chain dehydrogenase [Nitratireductor aquibiodomus]|uniref:Short-chain dehydrogenase n=1 Tax=Nitratireductor aquibiodomus TaxID=204799 RepID=A0A1H4IN33_9HYPH|nr:SDR family NAD(P)-dependent oxidoreductase [Nitratireductor aquibiodomus]SEB35471.1 Short-chain dehydrogenase [Nitratireductor aquibiodomus]
MARRKHKGIVWVTGASSGIGRALALRLARNGWQVAASARSAAALEELAADQEGSIFPYPLDVTDMARTKQVHAEIELAMGSIDMAVLAAGTYKRDGAFDFRAQVAQSMIAVNLQGTCNALEPLLDSMMSRRRGKIAIMASVAGYNGLPGGATYGATKSALNNLCEAMKPEAERRNVSLSVINPGFVDTPLTARNDFPMPFLISADEAAASIEKGLEDGRYEIIFPWKMKLAIKFLHALPAMLRFTITRRLVRAPD